MVIVSNYETRVNGSTEIYVCQDECFCPECGSSLKHRDWKRRHNKYPGKEPKQVWFVIERKRCTKCRKIHSILPEFVVPYKHYKSELIEDVVDEFISEADTVIEDYPCESTLKRWKEWIELNKNLIESTIRTTGYKIFKLGTSFLKTKENVFDIIRNKYRDWLKYIIIMIYNQGLSLIPIYSF